jgi:hypothetical protein
MLSNYSSFVVIAKSLFLVRKIKIFSANFAVKIIKRIFYYFQVYVHSFTDEVNKFQYKHNNFIIKLEVLKEIE